MTDYGHNFDPNGQKLAFQSQIHKMIAELHSKSQKDFKTFDEYDQWVKSVYAKYKNCFNTEARQSFENAHKVS